MSKRWFTADQHFGHFNVIRYCDRPFKDVQEMEDELVRRWNEVVAPGDTVYCVGDFSLSPQIAFRVRDRLRACLKLIPGNHDKCWPGKDKTGKWWNRYNEARFNVQAQEITLPFNGGLPVQVGHLPYRNLNDPDQRYAEDRPVDRGQWRICGHVHEKWRVKGRQINVGVDVWNFYPVSEGTIKQIIAGKFQDDYVIPMTINYRGEEKGE